jgi:hypothetical protein
MLDTSRLAVAGISASKNQRLQDLWTAVQDYNAVPWMHGSTNTKSAGTALDKVAVLAGDYLTSKPPQPKMKNRMRWNALRALAEQVGAEAQKVGIRLLSGPSDFQKIDRAGAAQSYWLERIDPQHRAGFVLSQQWQGWLKDPTARQQKQSFWDHIGTDQGQFRTIFVKYYPEGRGLEVADHFKRTWDANEDLVDEFDDPYDTEDKQTHFSGKGWAVFVSDLDWTIYSGNHEAGVHHHSSFTGGSAVTAAGELVVREGTVLAVTAKSGHYKPTPENILQFVRKHRQIPGGVVVRPDLGDMAKHHEIRYHWCWQLRSMGLGAPALRRGEVLSTIPQFAQSNYSPLSQAQGQIVGGFMPQVQHMPA